MCEQVRVGGVRKCMINFLKKTVASSYRDNTLHPMVFWRPDLERSACTGAAITALGGSAQKDVNL